MIDQLTDQQIENWRSVLVGIIGPYALLMPDEQVQALRDRYQDIADKLPKAERRNERRR